MADRRLVYTVEIDATQAEAAARKLREALAQITAGAGQNGQKADPAARQVESLKAAEAQAKETAKALGAISGINISTAGLDQLRERLSQIRREASITQQELARVMGEGGSGRSQEDAARFQQLVTNVRNMVDETTANRLQNIGYAPQAWINAEFPPEHPEQYEKFFQSASAKDANMSGAGTTRMSREAQLESLRLQAEADDLQLKEAQIEKAIAQREIAQIEQAISALNADSSEQEFASLIGAYSDMERIQNELVTNEAELMTTAAASAQRLNEAIEEQKAKLARAALSETGDIETFASTKTGAGSNTLNIGIQEPAVARARELTAQIKDQNEALREQIGMMERIAARSAERFEREQKAARELRDLQRSDAKALIDYELQQRNEYRQKLKAEGAEARAAAAERRAAAKAIRDAERQAEAEKRAAAKAIHDEERAAAARKRADAKAIRDAERQAEAEKRAAAKAQADADRAAAQQRRASMFGPGSMLGQMFSPTNLLYGAAGALGIYSADQVARQLYGGGREGAQQIRQMETFRQFAGRLNVDANALIAGIKKASNETITETDAMGIAAQTLAQKFAASSSDIVGDLEQIVAFSRRASQIYTDEQGAFLSTQEVFARLIKFTREGNKELVDQFGLSNQRIADALGMTVKGLASASGAADRWRGLVKVLGEEMDRLGAPIQTVADKIEQSEARITSATNRIKQALAPTTAGVAEFGAGAAERFSALSGTSTISDLGAQIGATRAGTPAQSPVAAAYDAATKAVAAYGAALSRNQSQADKFTDGLQAILTEIVRGGFGIGDTTQKLDAMTKQLQLVASGQDAYSIIMSRTTQEGWKQNAQIYELTIKISELEALYLSGQFTAGEYSARMQELAGALSAVAVAAGYAAPAISDVNAAAANTPYALAMAEKNAKYADTDSYNYGRLARMFDSNAASGSAERTLQNYQDRQANYDYTAEGQQKLRTQFAMKLHEEQAQLDRRLAEQTAAKAQSEWEAAAKAAQAKWESAISSIPGLFGTSGVTAEQMAAAEAGVPQRFADSWLRELKDEVFNKVDRPNVDIRDAAARLGLDPNTDPKAIYAQVEEAWRNSSLFAGGKNTDLIDLGAVQASLDQQAASESGQQAIKDYLAGLGMGPGAGEAEKPADAILPAPEDMKDKASALTGAIKVAFDGDQVRADFEAVGGAVIGYIHAGYATGALAADWTGPIVDAVVAQLSGQLATMMEGDEGAPPPP